MFAFWEPRGAMPPYLKLCTDTWAKNLKGSEPVVLNYSNLPDYIGDVYDMDVLRRFPLPVQKDALLVAVLAAHGGVFLDVDTLVLRDISPIVRMLQDSDLIMFNAHLAFVAANRGARLLTMWREEVRETLRRLKRSPETKFDLGWDFLGNRPLARAKRQLILGRHGTHPLRLPAIMRRAHSSLEWRTQRILFRTIFRRHLAILDASKTGFIAESARQRGRVKQPDRAYRKFWFGLSEDQDSVWRADPILVGLHNSWTPRWYQELSAQEVLAHECTLSRTLRKVLG